MDHIWVILISILSLIETNYIDERKNVIMDKFIVFFRKYDSEALIDMGFSWKMSA